MGINGNLTLKSVDKKVNDLELELMNLKVNARRNPREQNEIYFYLERKFWSAGFGSNLDWEKFEIGKGNDWNNDKGK